MGPDAVILVKTHNATINRYLYQYFFLVWHENNCFEKSLVLKYSVKYFLLLQNGLPPSLVNLFYCLIFVFVEIELVKKVAL